MDPPDRKLYLRETVTDDDFFRFVGGEGYVLVRQSGPDDGLPLQYDYRSPDGRTTVRYIEEPIAHLPLLLIWSEHPNEVASKARRYLDVVDRDEILSMYDPEASPLDRAKALAFLALLASDGFDPRIVEVIRRAVRDADPEVRLEALLAMRYAPWPDILPFAKQLLEDPDHRVREEARGFLDAYDEMRREGRLPKERR